MNVLPSDTILAKIDVAHQALLEARTIREVKKIADMAQAAKIYAQRQKLGSEVIQYAHSLVIEAERRLGEMIVEQKKTVGLATGTRGQLKGRDSSGGAVVEPPERKEIPLSEAGISKKVSAKAQYLARLPEDLFEKVRTGEMKMPHAAKELRKREAPDAPPAPAGKFRVLYADPPWEYGNKYGEHLSGYPQPDHHYPTMTLQTICDLPIREMTDENAVLFLWATSPLLEDALKVVGAWGFRYKTSFVWDKMKHNFGHYNSVRHEFLLIATKGSCTPDAKELHDSVISIERTEHSAKPEYFRELIDKLYTHGKRIELFAREKKKGWESWGNQIS